MRWWSRIEAQTGSTINQKQKCSWTWSETTACPRVEEIAGARVAPWSACRSKGDNLNRSGCRSIQHQMHQSRQHWIQQRRSRWIIVRSRIQPHLLDPVPILDQKKKNFNWLFLKTQMMFCRWVVTCLLDRDWSNLFNCFWTLHKKSKRTRRWMTPPKLFFQRA